MGCNASKVSTDEFGGADIFDLDCSVLAAADEPDGFRSLADGAVEYIFGRPLRDGWILFAVLHIGDDYAERRIDQSGKPESRRFFDLRSRAAVDLANASAGNGPAPALLSAAFAARRTLH
jgi:hypothetical protein